MAAHLRYSSYVYFIIVRHNLSPALHPVFLYTELAFSLQCVTLILLLYTSRNLKISLLVYYFRLLSTRNLTFERLCAFRLCIYIYIYIHTYTYIYIHACIHMYILVYTQTHTHTYIHSHKQNMNMK
jgi:hypothetical protein